MGKLVNVFPTLNKEDGTSAFEHVPESTQAVQHASDSTNAVQHISVRCFGNELSQDKVQALLQRLRDRCAIKEFQVELKDMRSRGFGASKKRKLVARLLKIVWKRELSRAGFRINASGFPDFLAVVSAHLEHPGIRIVASEIERNLFFQPGDLFKPKACNAILEERAVETKLQHPSKSHQERAMELHLHHLSKTHELQELEVAPSTHEATVQVKVRDPCKGKEISVQVPATASFGHVKDAVLHLMGQPEITHLGPLMAQEGNQYISLLESDPLGERRSVVMSGFRPELAAAKAGLPEHMGSFPLQAQVVVRHATRKREVLLSLPVTATVLDVKEVLLHKYTPPAPRRKVIIATREKNTFQYLNDKELLAGRHELVVLGLTLTSCDI